MISKLVAAALDACEVVQKKEKKTLREKMVRILQVVSSERHALLNKLILSS